MKAAILQAIGRAVLNPACGMHVNPTEAGDAAAAVHGEKPFFFCSDNCNSDSSPSRPAREAGGREAMIERIIDFSVRNKFLVLLLVAAAALAGARARKRAARRNPGPRRHAGHRLLAIGS